MAKRPAPIPAHLQRRIARIHVLTHAELGRLFAVITSLRDQALFLLAYRHGLRASEVTQMKRADLDLQNPRIRIQRLNRGNHDRHPLKQDEVAALREYLKTRDDKSVVLFLGAREGPISRRALDWLMKSYGHQAKLPHVKRHFHALKHSVAVHLLSAGADLHYVHDWLGHNALQNSALYLYLVPSQAKPRFEHPQLPGGSPK